MSAAAEPARNDNGGGPASRKLIELGWDSPNPETLLANLALMEKTPFDGVRVQLDPKEEGGVKATLRNLFSAAPWQQEWFRKDVELLKKVRSKKLTDNFLSAGPGPTADWFDDAAWEQIAEHARIAAWIAKEGGLKGILFDPELGTNRNGFHYNRLPRKAGHSFAEYSAQARKRGREMMEALKKEYPEMTLFTLFLNSGPALGALGSDPREGLEAARNYNLYPAFVNGWLDAIPPGMTLIDGAEYAYPHSEELQYLKHVNAIRNTAMAYIAPENRRKYRAQAEAGLALYMDAYACLPLDNVHSDVYNDPPLEGRLVDRLQAAVTSAREASDRYVWVWGEHYRWWPTPATRVAPQSWDDILPGASEALRKGMDPEEGALARATKELAITERKLALRGKTLPNRVQNGGFTPGEEKAAALEGWTANQADGSKGVLSGDAAFGRKSSGSARIENAANAWFSQEVEVKPFAFYSVRLRVRQMGAGRPEIRLRWAGHDSTQPAALLTPAESPRDGWQPVSGTLHAPAWSNRLVIELAATGQRSPNDVIWFDDVELIPISIN